MNGCEACFDIPCSLWLGLAVALFVLLVIAIIAIVLMRSPVDSALLQGWIPRNDILTPEIPCVFANFGGGRDYSGKKVPEYFTAVYDRECNQTHFEQFKNGPIWTHWCPMPDRPKQPEYENEPT